MESKVSNACSTSTSRAKKAQIHVIPPTCDSWTDPSIGSLAFSSRFATRGCRKNSIPSTSQKLGHKAVKELTDFQLGVETSTNSV